MDKFNRHDSVIHTKSGIVYMIVLGPCNGIRIHGTVASAYLYQRFWAVDDSFLWVMASAKMEDGRFEFKHRSTHGACGRTPDV